MGIFGDGPLIISLLLALLKNIKSTLVISNSDIPKYTLLSKNIVWTHLLFLLFLCQLLLFQTTDISK